MTRSTVCTKNVFVVFQFPFSVNPVTWFRLWEAIDTYLSFHTPDQPMIDSGNVYSEEMLHFVRRLRFKSMVDHMIPIAVHMNASHVQTRFLYFVNDEMAGLVTLTNVCCDSD